MLLNDDRNFVTAAVEWATQNPGVLMPNIPVWGGYFGKDSSIEPLDLCNWMDKVKYHHVAPQIIPFMVALNLGRPLDELASIIKHHGITTHHLKEISFKSSEDFTLIEGKPWIPIVDLHLAFFKACDIDPELADRIETGRIHYSYSDEVRIALLQTSNPKAWLPFQLESDSIDKSEKAQEWVRRSATTFKLSDPKFWPNGSFGQLLERCGAFHDKTLRGDPALHANGEQGFWGQMIYESTFRLSKEEEREFFSLVVSLLTTEYSNHIVKALRTLERGSYGKTDFEALDNLFKAAEVSGAYGTLPGELIIAAAAAEGSIASFGQKYLDYTDSGIFEEICDAAALYFKKSSDQFMAIPFEELGWSEQRALWKIPQMNMPAQDFSGVDFEGLMTRMFQAGQTLPKAEEYRQQVINGQIQLAEYLAPSLKLSQHYLDNLSQDDLEIMVRAGAAPEMRSKLSLTGKARTFTQELGV